MLKTFVVLASLFGSSVAAETVVATTAVRSATILTAAHLAIVSNEVAGAISNPADLIGLETRVNLYPNRPIFPRDVGAPRVVVRNEVVRLIFDKGPLRISVEGRALGDAGIGETVRAMNLGSRMTVHGKVISPGVVRVPENGS